MSNINGHLEKWPFRPITALSGNILPSEYRLYACFKRFSFALILSGNLNFSRQPIVQQQSYQNSKLRILHIFGGMNRGGAEMRTLDLMRRIDRSIFQMEFCALSGLPGILDGDIRALGGEVYYCKLRSLSFNRRFRTLLREGRYDVVHSHVHCFSGYILRLAHQCGVPLRIAHFRNTTDVQSKTIKRRIQTALMRSLIDKYATHILAVGEGAMQAAWRADWQSDSRCKVIPNGLETACFHQGLDKDELRARLNVPADAPLIIHVGRMAKPKNHIRLARILAFLLPQLPAIHVLLAGQEDTVIKQQMLERFKLCGVENRVHFLGVRDDVPKLLMISDLLLFPSLWEGLPGSVLEACAAGTPVLASHIPGIIELTKHFSNVHSMHLNEPDQRWVSRVTTLLKQKPTDTDRLTALKEFDQSDYTIDNCAAAHYFIWTGHGAKKKLIEVGRQ